ncbi:arylsulfatase [Pontiella sulfatireligans]|uniref:Arylsulfatase n=1 Tax=Pontiella sulfatireligans TaxID=2750658 RepID=A0A6C2UF91_9BACT|nr:arylsulfatase [Pontiella sulfatireligans]SPS74183.1 sulfatase S1_17 [Kiritimatiellales bacterium]VGO18543.1 Arylsulfatase [Pontiella sulfatireligans]
MKQMNLILVLLAGALSLQAATVDRLNVVVVMTDDQGYGDISYHGNDVIKTPHMDRLAESSVRFTDFHVNPFCSPTRAALMTGRMSDRTGVLSTQNTLNYMRLSEVLMPEYFRAAGYRTGHFGKWHIGSNYPLRSMDRGFEETLCLGNSGQATASDVWNNDRMDDGYYHNGKIVKRKGFGTDVYFDEAMAFMKTCKQERKPFFTYLATSVPHWEWNVPLEWMQPYLDAGVSRERAAFYASVGRADLNLGRLMDFLETEKLADNTILVFLTDNGSDVPQKSKQGYKNGGMRGYKGAEYEGGHRVPCFFRAPAEIMGEPRDIDVLTAHLDLLPTFIDLCGLKGPNRDLPPLDGRSLKPLLKGDSAWDDRLIVLHTKGISSKKPGSNFVAMTSDWRLVTPKNRKAELYDMRNDRGQKNDVADQYPEVLESLKQRYFAHFDTLNIKEPNPRPHLSGKAVLRLDPGMTENKNMNTQHEVRKALPMKKPNWSLVVEEAGTYRFEVRRWPREAAVPMSAGLPPQSDPNLEYIGHANYNLNVPGKAIEMTAVELTVAGKTMKKPVSKGDQGIFFDVELPIGPVDLEGWLLQPNGKRNGAYFIYAEKI